MEIQGGYGEISGQLANIGGRNDGLMCSFRHASPENCLTHDDENFSLEVALGREVELVMHGTDVAGVRVITPQ